jgi:AraC family transcriptional regulator, regulatory protein of adaptative response / methylated-DNA-[protein]-cysteine methyltransferase
MRLHVARFPVPILGAICLAATPYGVVRVHLGDEMARFQRELREAYPEGEIVGPDAAIRDAAKAIREYLGGGPDPRNVPIVLPEGSFSARVWREIQKIPRGEIRSYARVAKSLRKPGAARAVGQACGQNPVPLVIPCHRVISSDGGLGGFSGDLRWKKSLLDLEGVRLNGHA